MQIFSPVILYNSSCYHPPVFPLVCEVCFLWTWQRASPPPWAIPGRIWVNPTSLTWWACCDMVDVFSLHLLYYSCVQTTALYELEGQKGKKCRLYSEQAVLRNGAQLCLEGGLVKWKLICLEGELEKDNLRTTIIHSWCTGHPQYLQVWGFFHSRRKYVPDCSFTDSQQNPEPCTGAPGIAAHLFWKWRWSHLISSMCSWITEVTGTVPDHKLLKKNISGYKSCLWNSASGKSHRSMVSSYYTDVKQKHIDKGWSL